MPRYSLRSLLLVCTAFCVYFTIGKLAPLVAFALFCLLSVFAAQAAAMRLVHLEPTRRQTTKAAFFLGVLIAVFALLVFWFL